MMPEITPVVITPPATPAADSHGYAESALFRFLIHADIYEPFTASTLRRSMPQPRIRHSFQADCHIAARIIFSQPDCQDVTPPVDSAFAS